MKFSIQKGVATLAAVVLLSPLANAFGDTVPVPNPLPIPSIPALPLPVTIPAIPTLPAVNYPNPEATLAMLQGQINLIAAAAGETPEALLNKVLSTEIPSVGVTVTTVNGLLNRLAGTTIFDATSNGILGTTEIAIGNISHGFSLGSSIAKPAIDGPRCVAPAKVAPCEEAVNPWVSTFPSYSKVTSDWLPTIPAQSVLGTSIVLPLANGLTPGAPVAVPVDVPVTGVTPGDVPANVCVTAVSPQLCQGISSLIKSNLTLISEPGGQLVNIQGGGWTVPNPTPGGAPIKKGVHNGGTGALNGTNLDTGYRKSTQADPSPVWLPLLTATAALADDSVDFLGFSPTKPTVSNGCTNNKDDKNKTIPTTYSTNADGVEIAHFPASTCKSSGSFSGFGIAVYGKSPVNFRTDLAPLWEPAPAAAGAVADAAAAVVASLSPYLPPSGLGVLTYPPVTFALGMVGVATNLQGQLLGLQDDLPVPVPAVPEVPEAPDASVPPSIPALPAELEPITSLLPLP